MSTAHKQFDGQTATSADDARLSTQLDAVRQIMLSGARYSLKSLASAVASKTGRNATEASVSARLRDLRKPRFGGLVVDRINSGDGMFVYQVRR